MYSVEPLRQADANGGCIGVVNIDIDYGHDTGDGVQRSIASRMENHLKEMDLKALIRKADMAMYEET